jgi:acetyltransferase-like isoleucine patch superfamily enzyme
LRNISEENFSIQVGAFSYGVSNLQIKSWGGKGTHLSIGKFCSIAQNVTVFLGGNHRTDWITTYPFGYIYNVEFGGVPDAETIYSNGDVSIKNDVWIGENVTIMSGVSIGNGAVLATGSVITRDVSDYEIVGGNPAKQIRMRFMEDQVAMLLRLKWWDLPEEDVKAVVGSLQMDPSDSNLTNLLLRFTR